MYKTILLCYDGSVEGRKGLREGAVLAHAMSSNTHLLAICRTQGAMAPPEGMTPAFAQGEEDTARALLDEGVRKLIELGIKAQGALLIGDPLVHIPQYAARIKADLVVMGHRPRSRIARWWSDSPQSLLLDRIPCSILIAMNADEVELPPKQASRPTAT
ncbi:MAG TPA: universal stress protein [Steroidobacteraceae bacterium]|jgi:nucleotide-binding universal stress UspA family protein|nr:universal stress protein [Steroidobacteraceae bacterium]